MAYDKDHEVAHTFFIFVLDFPSGCWWNHTVGVIHMGKAFYIVTGGSYVGDAMYSD